MLTYILFVIGFALVIKGADFLVDGASMIARRLRVSDLIIGLTIVAFGTSAPELVVNILASIRGNADIAIGNILGSNIFNILFILGISALIFPLDVTQETVWKQIPLSLLAAISVWIMANDRIIDHQNISLLSRTDGLVFILFFAIFLYYIAGIAIEERERIETVILKQISLLKAMGMVALALVALYFGAKWIVDGAVKIATALGVSQSLIALTIVAAGTSIPELATSVMATYRRNPDIAVGNIVGSNIFNIFFIISNHW